jgi:hypothetical protein
MVNDDLPEEPDSDTQLTKEERLEAERNEVLASVAAAKLDTLQEKVAWILNHYPTARHSDITLQIHFWEEFEPDLGSDDYIRKADLYTLTRLTSLARARATLQNTYKLFQASPAVRAARGTLAEEETVKAAEQQMEIPVFDVYADESGKTAKYLIVGSVWCLHPPELLQFRKDIFAWRDQASRVSTMLCRSCSFTCSFVEPSTRPALAVDTKTAQQRQLYQEVRHRDWVQAVRRPNRCRPLHGPPKAAT